MLPTADCHAWSYYSRIAAFLSDDSGRTWKETGTLWPKNGNDESTAVETQNGDVLMFSEPGHAKCPGAPKTFPGSEHRCMLMARSSTGGVWTGR